VDLDSFLVSLYVLVDDWWHEHHPSSARKRKPGRPALLFRSRDHHPGDPRPVVAPLQKRARLLALRFGAPACLHFPNPCTLRVSSTAGCGPWRPSCALCSGPSPGISLRAFGRLPRLGHDSGAGHGPSEGFSQGASRKGHFFCGQVSFREECLQDLKWVYGFSRWRWWSIPRAW
jgi:hypothetical protein